MRKSKGATLIEALLALALGSIILVAFLGAIAPVQSLAWDLSAVHDRDSTLCLAPPLLGKWISGAGNGRPRDGSSCVREATTLHVRSDSDGSTGFPDGDLDESYESVSIRQNGSDLQIKSGPGSYQPVFRNTSLFESDTTDPLLILLRLGAQTDKRLIRLPQTEPKQVLFHVYIWNQRPNLFEEAP